MDRVLSDKRPVRRLRKRDIERAASSLLKEEEEYAEEKKRVRKQKFKEMEDDIIDL